MRSRLFAASLPLAILAAIVMALGLTAGAPYLLLSEIDQEIAAGERTLVELRKEIASESDMRKENLDLVALGQQGHLLLEGDTAGISGANLQKLISDIVLEHGGASSSLQLLATSEDGSLVRIALRLSISVGIDGLRDIVHGIETGKPLLFIDDLSVRAVEDRAGGTDPHYLGPLDVTMQVSGFRLKDKAS
ncbi:MAG: type II secretion system protein GspM [Hyphomicrobium sp.]